MAAATLCAGSYERFLFGFGFHPGGSDAAAPAASDGGASLQRAFIQAAHQGVVKCLAAGGQWVASGGADDLVHLYDIKTNKDLGFLMNPAEGAVTAAAFYAPPGGYAPTHLLTGSADGAVCVWAAGGGWEAMKTMRGHRKEVTGIAVHPSGKLALTSSRDGYLRMWNLVKGRCTYTSRLPVPADALAFAPDGGCYALLSGSCVALHATGGGVEGEGPLATLDHPRRVLCMAFYPAEASGGGLRLVTGCEDGSLRLWEAGGARGAAELACAPRAHATRIRALALLPQASAGAGAGASGTGAPLRVATASSDGAVKVWEFGGGAGAPRCLAQAETRARLTCLVALDGPAAMAARLKAEGRAKQAAAAAAAAGSEAVGAAAASPRQQLLQAGKKRLRQAGGTAAAAAQQQQQGGKEQQQSGGGRAGGRAARGGREYEGGEGAGERVVVHDGVVEFPDGEGQAQREADRARLRAKKKQRREARQQQQQQQGGSSGGGGARKKGRGKGAAFRPSAKPGRQMPGAERG